MRLFAIITAATYRPHLISNIQAYICGLLLQTETGLLPQTVYCMSMRVCLCVCHDGACVLRKRMNRSMCRFGADWRGPEEPCVRWIGEGEHWRHLTSRIDRSVR